MRILLITAHPYPPEISGGAQSSMDQMAQALIRAGHSVAVLCGLSGTGRVGLRARIALKLGWRPVARDMVGDYPVFRGWFPWDGVSEVARRFAPDIAVPHSGLSAHMGRACRAAGIPVMTYCRNVEPEDLGDDLGHSADAFLANSQFTAGRLATLYGIDATVIPPLFDRARYTTVTNRRFVTFINPHPSKGRDIAIAVARALPDIAFLFVRAWTLDRQDERLLAEVERDCPNVSVVGPTRSMRDIYAQTRIVLAPSCWEEAWGRIATEAHFSGIPVIATAIGGLPESVGPGGILLPPDGSIETWVEALQSLVTDPDRYEMLSKAALVYARRPEIDPERQIASFLEQATDIIDRTRSVSGNL